MRSGDDGSSDEVRGMEAQRNPHPELVEGCLKLELD
jgi:hypothetical protein